MKRASRPIGALVAPPSTYQDGWLVEATYVAGTPNPLQTHAWPIIGWTVDQPQVPVVVEPHGGLTAKQVSNMVSQDAGGSDVLYTTRIAATKLDVGRVQRELRDMLAAAVNHDPTIPGQVTVEDVELPA